MFALLIALKCLQRTTHWQSTRQAQHQLITYKEAMTSPLTMGLRKHLHLSKDSITINTHLRIQEANKILQAVHTHYSKSPLDTHPTSSPDPTT